MLYTIYPLELVLEEPEETAAPLFETALLGRQILAARGADGSLTLQRLLSTDPMDYLVPGLQPGTAVPR